MNNHAYTRTCNFILLAFPRELGYLDVIPMGKMKKKKGCGLARKRKSGLVINLRVFIFISYKM